MSPWLVLAGLGAFHGLNPAMGWLFAVALGLHRNSRRALWLSLVPIALGHIASIGLVVLAFIAVGAVLDPRWLARLSGLLLIAWATYLLLLGHHHRVRVGMQAGLAGLALWSFLMATSHGAGLMLIPAVIPLCISDSSMSGLAAEPSIGLAVAAVAVHSAAMIAVIALAAGVVYEWAGVGFLRRGWINLDYVWIAALLASGVFLILSA